MRPVLGPHARTDRTWDTRVAEPRLPAPEDGRPGEGQRLTPHAPHNGGRPPPPGDGPPPPPRHAAPTGHAGQGDSVGPPHPHTRAHSTWVADPNSPPSGRAVGGGTAPDLRRPSQWWKAPPPGDALPPPPQRAMPARKGARCGAGAGSPRPHRPHPGHTGRGTLATKDDTNRRVCWSHATSIVRGKLSSVVLLCPEHFKKKIVKYSDLTLLNIARFDLISCKMKLFEYFTKHKMQSDLVSSQQIYMKTCFF